MGPSIHFPSETPPPLQVKDMIEGGDVLVNWREVSDQLKEYFWP